MSKPQNLKQMEPLHCLEMPNTGHQSCDDTAPHPRSTENMSCAVILAISVKVDFFPARNCRHMHDILSSFHMANEEDGSVFMYILFVTYTLHFLLFNNCAYCWLRKCVVFFRWMRCTEKRQSSTACSITSSSLAS